jgi:hypothetical protein
MPELLRAFFQSVYMCSNRLLNNARSSSPSTSNSSSGMDTRQDKENCLEDMLELVLEPHTRARLWGLVRFLIFARTPRSTSDNLSFENSSSTIRVSYFSDSRMASTFPLHMLRSRECKSLTAMSWSSYGSTTTLALMLFSITVKL